MRAARIVSLVLFTLVATLPGVAQLLNQALPSTGLTQHAYSLKLDFKAKPPVPALEWSQDSAFATTPVEPTREFASPLVIGRRSDRLPDDDSVCYTARSYLYARASRHSDVTMPVGYRVCTPSAKFQVKSADLPRR